MLVVLNLLLALLQDILQRLLLNVELLLVALELVHECPITLLVDVQGKLKLLFLLFPAALAYVQIALVLLERIVGFLEAHATLTKIR